MATAPPLLTPGTVLGGYALGNLIARGGMGEVYQARQLSLQRVVALKVLDPVLASRDPGFADRFIAEARAAGRLNHPNIIQVHEVDRCPSPVPVAQELVFFSMELIEGESLRDYLDREECCDEATIARVMCAMADALAYAEQAGIVHRDIKPDNILLVSDGRVKLADLGLATPTQTDTGPERDRNGKVKVMGTPLYMSPEQAKGLAVDHRCDQYSLGATLYHMLTGQPPFAGADAKSIMKAHVTAPVPDPRELDASLPAAWSELCMRLMAKEPDDRCDHATDLIEAVRAASGGTTVLRRPRSRRYLIPSLATLLVVAAAMVVIWPSRTEVQSAPALPAVMVSATAPAVTVAVTVTATLAPSSTAMPIKAAEPVPSAPASDLAQAIDACRQRLDYLSIKATVEHYGQQAGPRLKPHLATLARLGEYAQAGESSVRALVNLDNPTVKLRLDGPEREVTLLRLTSQDITLRVANEERRLARASTPLPWNRLLRDALRDHPELDADAVRLTCLWMWRSRDWADLRDTLSQHPVAQALTAVDAGLGGR